MKVLVTGAGGWLGSELVGSLLDIGVEVRAFTRRKSRKLDELQETYKKKLDIFYGDICNEGELLNAIEGCNFVYHLAAKVHCSISDNESSEEFFNVNTKATHKLFKICLDKKVKRVILYSSVSVYGSSESIIDIECIKDPKTPYAKSKLLSEEIGLDMYQKHGLPITIIEPVTVYGGDDIGNFNKLYRLSKKRISITFGDGNNKKTVIFYKDLIKLTLNIAYDSKMIGRRIICGSEVLTINDINRSFNTKKIYFKFRVNKKFSLILAKILKKFDFFKNISRNIEVLMSNNIYDISESKKYMDSYVKFNKYYGELK